MLSTNQIRDQYWYTAGIQMIFSNKTLNACPNNFRFYCSAGVGRTGTLIAIDTALAQASKERQMDIPKIIVNMRKQRMRMVQTVVGSYFLLIN